MRTLRCFSVLVIFLGSVMIAFAQDKRPNILWLTCEDNNITWVGCYGNPHAKTPNIDKLASEGFRYTNCFANAPVCAPSRSTWITGIHAISMGTHPMRSRYPIPHDKIKYYPDYLRKAGYFVSNCKKTDYNIGGRPDGDCWDSREKYAWRKRKAGQPFFCVINNTSSHESKAQGSVENTKHDPKDVQLHKYHPDLPDMRKNYAKYHDAMEKMDREIGQALAELKKDGLDQDTIVIHDSDHGGVLPRSKRFLFESGIHCPLIIRIPEKFKHLYPAAAPGSTVDEMVSFIDMPKTWLSLAGAEIPDVMQGRIFLGPAKEAPRKYHFSFRGRMDERLDNQRAVRDSRFLYIKNYMPYVPWGQHLNYLWKMRATQVWEQYYLAGKTNAITGRFFHTKPLEELYDAKKDPDCVNNLIDSPEYKSQIAGMRKALRAWQVKIHDAGLGPEAEVAQRALDNKMTIYELVRKPELYNAQAYLDASDAALAKKPDLAQMKQLMKDKDSIVRFWGTVGCFLLGQDAASAVPELQAALGDKSHEVRIMAAWTLTRLGKTDGLAACYEKMVAEKSYAMLTLLNVADLLGKDKNGDLLQALKKYSGSNINASYCGRMVANLNQKYNAGIPGGSSGRKPKKKKGKRKKK